MAKNNINAKKFNGQQWLNAAINSMWDIMRRSNCAEARRHKMRGKAIA
jgi:hypothetical protein